MPPGVMRAARAYCVAGALLSLPCLISSASRPLPSSLERLRLARGGYNKPPPPGHSPFGSPDADGEGGTATRAPVTAPPPPQPRPWGPVSSGTYSYQKYYTATPDEKQDTLLFPRIMRAVGSSAVCVLFLILTARTVHLYELADQIRTPILRYACTLPAVALLSLDLLGVLLSLVQSVKRNSRLKARLKAIVAVNGASELLMMLYNIVRLVLGSDKYTPREAYVTRLFVSVWFLTLTYSFATSRWDTGGGPSTGHHR